MTASDKASGMPTPRTDACEEAAEDATTYCLQGWQMARKLERELSTKECELQQARTMHAEAIEEWAKWEGAAKQARGEALEEAAKVCDDMWATTNSLAHSKLAGEMARHIRALNPSPASGEQTNAAVSRGRSTNGSAPKGEIADVIGTAPAAPNTAPQATEYQHKPQHYPTAPAAVPDDPVAGDMEWLHRFLNCSVFSPPPSEIQRAHRVIDALAAHYEAKGMRRAAEVCRSLKASSTGAEFAKQIETYSTKQEADR